MRSSSFVPSFSVRAFSRSLIANFIGITQFSNSVLDLSEETNPERESSDSGSVSQEHGEEKRSLFASPVKIRQMGNQTTEAITSSLQNDIELMMAMSLQSQREVENEESSRKIETPNGEKMGESLFSTASGKSVTISDESMNRAKEKLGESLFSTARGKPLEISDESMNRAKEKMGESLFSTASGKDVPVTPLQMQQANALLECLADQENHRISSLHALPGSPQKNDSPVSLLSNRQRIECEAGNDGPIKPQLSAPLPPPKNNPRPSIPKKKKKRTGYVPIKINNNNFIYESSEERKNYSSKQNDASHVDTVLLSLMDRSNYHEATSDLHPFSFSTLTKQFDSPFSSYYKDLFSTVMKSIEENNLLNERNALTAVDIQFTMSHCQYEAQTKLKEALTKSGVSQFILSINHRNSEFVLYEGDDPMSLPSSFYTDESDNPSPMFSRLIQLLSAAGADPTLLSVAWIRCQYRNIIWKQSSKVKWSGECTHLQLRFIIRQLLWRYITELYISFFTITTFFIISIGFLITPSKTSSSKTNCTAR